MFSENDETVFTIHLMGEKKFKMEQQHKYYHEEIIELFQAG